MIKLILIISLYNLIVSLFTKRTNNLYCGLVGYSGISNFDVDKIKLLLYWNSIERSSKDSTGIYSKANGLIKEAVAAEKFIADKNINIIEDNILLGHVRLKSQGAVNKKNAHPFKFGNLYGVHNGTLIDEYKLLYKTPFKWSDFDVDSEVIFARLNHERTPAVLTELEGSAAIMFTIDDEQEQGKIYAFRNSERPLYRGVINDGMYLSSIENSLVAIGCKDIKMLSEDYFYTIKDGKILDYYKLKTNKAKTVRNSSTNSTNTTTYNSSGHYDDMVGRWVYLKDNKAGEYTSMTTPYKNIPYHLVGDKWYYIQKFDGSQYDKVCPVSYTEKLAKVTYPSVPAFIFEQDSYTFRSKEHGIAMDNITFKGTNKVAAELGDVLLINEIVDGKLDVKCLRTNAEFIISASCVRKLTFIEQSAVFRLINSKDNIDLNLKNINTVLKEMKLLSEKKPDTDFNTEDIEIIPNEDNHNDIDGIDTDVDVVTVVNDTLNSLETIKVLIDHDDKKGAIEEVNNAITEMESLAAYVKDLAD